MMSISLVRKLVSFQNIIRQNFTVFMFVQSDEFRQYQSLDQLFIEIRPNQYDFSLFLKSIIHDKFNDIVYHSFFYNNNKMQKVLCAFTVNPDFVEFAIPELKSLLHDAPFPIQTLFRDQLQNKQYSQFHQINHKLFKFFPYVILKVPDFEKHRKYFEGLCKTAVMVYKVVLLISSGSNYNELLKNRNEQLLQKYCRNENEAVVCDFYSRNRVILREDQVQKIHKVLGQFDVRGHVDFKNPLIRYQLMQEHQWYQNHHKIDPSNTLRQVYFGIQLCSNKIVTAKFNFKYELNKRIYLGPTSADNDLAFLMCNQALVKDGSIVIDPFVGTGGLLIPPSSKGAITFGSDLDIRVINGYSVGRINTKSPFYSAEKKYELFTPKIMLNFEQYGFSMPNIIRIDSTKLTLREGQFFDAIITDPPYGIRAMSRSVTSKKQKDQEAELKDIQKPQIENQQVQQEISKQQSQKQEGLPDEQLQAEKERKKQKRKHQRENKKMRKELLPEDQKRFKQDLITKMNKERVDQWDKYDKNKIETTARQTIFFTLLEFASKYLVQKGRLVFLYPVYEQEEYVGVKNIPKHEGFSLIDLSENKMSKGNSRILVTLEKL